MTDKTIRYTVTVTGKCGDFWFIQTTPEQAAYWREQGEDKLREHLTSQYDKDTPPEFALGRYDDSEIQTSGVEFTDEDADFVVHDESGEDEDESGSIEDGDLDNFVLSRQTLDAPSPGAFFRTYQYEEWRWELELSKPFEFSLMRFGATVTPKGVLVNRLIYDGVEVPLVNAEAVKEWKQFTAELLS